MNKNIEGTDQQLNQKRYKSRADPNGETGTLPGNHFSIIVPTDQNSRQYTTLRKELLLGLNEPYPRVSDSKNKALRSAPTNEEVFEEMETFPRFSILIEGNPITVVVHAGPIDQIQQVDIIVSSENVYFEMAKPFKPSTSGRLRRASAKKNDAGEIIDDITFNELNSWMRKNGKLGLAVPVGTVATTSSGELFNKEIKRIYHAAVVIPRIGSNEYQVDPKGLSHAVHNTFDQARSEREKFGLSSICFPLFGAGRGKLPPRESIETMWPAINRELSNDPNWEIHFCTWRRDETAELLNHLYNLE